MKTLVTGGAGFIGSNLVDRLLKDGHEVTVIDNESAECNEQFYWNPDAKNYKYGITDYVMTRNLYEGVDVVFHLAAESRIGPCWEDPLRAVETNTLGTATVLQCARVCKVKRVIYSSTSASYGLINDPPMVETMPLQCLNPYAVTKVNGEDICKMYSEQFGVETVIFRYFNVYGNRQPLRGQYAPVVGIFMDQAESGKALTVVGDGEQRRDFVNVHDVVEANLLAANFVAPDSTWKWGQIYNIGSGVNYSVNEIADMIGGSKTHIPARPGEARHTLADSSKALNHFGWKSTIYIQNWIGKNIL